MLRCVLTFDLAKHAIPKWCTGRKWHIPMASNRKKSRRRIWLTKMHWKRLTSELHDSYFRLMTIKHAIPKTEWAIELLYNRKSACWRSDKLETRCGRESHHPAEGALGTPDRVWGPDQWVIRCRRESQQSVPPGLQLSSPGEQERHNADGHKSGGQYIAVFVQSPTPSHTQTLQIKWEVYFLKKTSLVFIHCVDMYYICICIMCLYC